MKKRSFNLLRYCKGMNHDIVNLLEEGRCADAKAALTNPPVKCPQYHFKQLKKDFNTICGGNLSGAKRKRK